MEKHEQERKQRTLLGAQRQMMDWDDDLTFQPPRARPIPDFKKAQKKFQKMLDKKRSYKKPTKIKEFRFSSTKRVPKIDYLEYENDQKQREFYAQQEALKNTNKKNLQKMRKRIRSTPKKHKLSTTKKYTAQVEKTKAERLKRRKEEERKHNERMLKKKRQRDVRKNFVDFSFKGCEEVQIGVGS